MSANKKNITAVREGVEREFGHSEWQQLPEHKYGWKKKAEEPKEVSDLKNKTAQGGGSTGTTEETKVNAADLATQILAAETIEAVDALVPDGEERKTVLQAAEKRKEQLANPQ